jgi:dipeptidyl aminopeptidase/acylaminoacyl peptidase
MPKPTIAPYGSWKSPITSDLIVSESIGLQGTAVDGDDAYWLELRPRESGRLVLVKRAPDGKPVDVTPQGYNVRTRVHEYGGGAFAVDRGTVYFANFADQRLYVQRPSVAPEPLTPEKSPGREMRFADFVVDRSRNRLVGVSELHAAGSPYPENFIAEIPLDGREVRPLVRGFDFYSDPRVSPDGSRLAWLSWNHPNMPWDGCELFVARMNPDGALEPRSAKVAGGLDESIYGPLWSPDGTLHFISDRTGWWNLYRFRAGRVEPLCPLSAEFGLPQWVFGRPAYAFESATRMLCSYGDSGLWRLARLDLETLRLDNIDLPYSEVRFIAASPGRALFIGASPSKSSEIALLDLASTKLEVLRKSTTVQIDPGYLSAPEPIEFPTENGLTAYALFYPPANKDFAAPPGQLPPLVVRSHGGPTAATSAGLNLSYQYFTSRGIAVVDVNYGGSTGYGREYRHRLDGNWGIVDVDDCCNAARFLVKARHADGSRLAIAGGSAGGYTTLCALAFRNVFHAGASYFGVSDAEALAKDTHKFESRYLDRLIGPYPARRDLYVARSPIHFVDRLSCPVIFLQGLEDEIVPPDQAGKMVDALKAKGLPVAYLTFEGEQHGFRKAENIKRSLDAEFYFYSRVFGFAPAETIEPVEIANAGKLPA